MKLRPSWTPPWAGLFALMSLALAVAVSTFAAPSEGQAPQAHKAHLPDFAEVAEAVSPSVVSLRVEAKQKTPPILHPFFGGQGGQEQLQRGAGSGVIIRSDG